MKKFKIVMLLLCACIANAWSADLTPAQKNAQLSLYSYLEKERFNPEVDVSDNSVCFRRDGVLYWITFTEDSPILYTFNRKGYKIGNEDNTYKRKPAIIAANDVNSQHKGVKVTVGEKKVNIAMEVYEADPKAFNAVFKKCFSMFEGIDEDFKKAYEHASKMEKETAEKIEEELRKNLPPSELRNSIENISIRLVNADGNETTPYDEPLRSFKANYIQARIEFKPWMEKSEDFTLQLKVTQPNGKPLYLPGKKYTAEMTVTLEKSKKNQMIEFDQFGTDKNGFWKAGEYKLEVLEGGDVIYTTTFNIL